MDILLSSQGWHDQRVIDHLSEALHGFFAEVAPIQQQRWMELAKRSEETQARLAGLLRALHRETADIASKLLAMELEKALGFPVDPHTARLNTWTSWRSKRAAAPGGESRVLITKTLWEAFREGFTVKQPGLTPAGPRSYITDAAGQTLPGLGPTEFSQILEKLALQEQVGNHLADQLQGRLRGALQDHCHAQVEFDLLHHHCENPTTFGVDELNRLTAVVNAAEQHWTLHALAFDGMTLILPFFVRTLDVKQGDAVFSYFPERPGGAWRRHPSLQSARDSLLQQIRDSAQAGRLEWLLRQLALLDQQRLAEHLRAPPTRLEDFNWLGLQLFRLFGNSGTAVERLRVETHNLEVKSLLRAVQDNRALRLYRDLNSIVTSHYGARRTWADTVGEIVSEILELILLPLPGGLLGAGKVVLVAALGSLAYQSASAILARQNGDAAQFVQAMADLVDFVISARINVAGARLSQRRSRQLVEQLGNPRLNSAGTVLDWQTPAPDPDRHLGTSAVGLLNKMLPSDWQRLDKVTAERLLNLACITREGLQAHWDAARPTTPILAALLQAERLRNDFDTFRHALDGDAPLPPLANELLPALLAREANVSVRIREPQASPPWTDYPAASGLTLDLTHTGQRRYRHTGDAGHAEASFYRAALLGLDRVQPDNTLGKRGDYAADSQLAHREEHLRHALQSRLALEQSGLFAGLLQKRLRGISAEAASPSPDERAIARAALALTTLADPHWQASPADAAHLAFAVLTTLPGWPVTLALNLYQATLGSNTELRATDRLIMSYGESTATEFVSLARLGSRYMAIDQGTGDRLHQGNGAYAVLDLVLRCLTDSQRAAIGYGTRDAAELSRGLLELGRLERGDLATLFAETNLIDLSESRLEAFRTHRTFMDSIPDEQGLYRLDGRQYVQLGDHYYQVLNDTDASAPHQPVLRIVRPGDAVADAPDHRYVASRPGRSEPIARDASGHWRGVLVGGLGGMPPKRQGKRMQHAVRMSRKQAEVAFQAASQQVLIVEAQLEPLTARVGQSDKKVNAALQLHQNVGNERTEAALNQATQERVKLLPEFVACLTRMIDVLTAKAATLDAFEATLLPSDSQYRTLWLGEYRGVLVRRIGYLDQVILCEDLLSTAAVQHLRAQPLEFRAEFIQHRNYYLERMAAKRVQAEQREADVQALRSRFAGDDVEERLALLDTGRPADSYYVKVAQVQFNCDLLTVGLGSGLEGVNTRPTHLAKDFFENAIALRSVAEVAHGQRVALLDSIHREFEHLTSAFIELQDQYAGTSLAERVHAVVAIVQSFEQRSSDELQATLTTQDASQPASRLIDDIDLDFLPPQPGRQRRPTAPRKRVIRIKRRGISTLALGEIRRAGGQEQIAVVAHDSGEVVQQYQKNADGHWRPELDSGALALPSPQALATLAASKLAAVDEQLATAQSMNRRNSNPTNIVEYLERHAEELLDSARQLPEQAQALTEGARRLTDQGLAIMIQRYKDPAVLDVHRLLFLMEHRQVTVARIERRLPLGKGMARHFLDVYAIRDKDTGQDLWHAHFHYPRADTADSAYPIRGGHLKTLEQSRLGREYQQRQEQAGQAVERIWRQELDRNSAAKLFALAQTSR
jgi:hypothetical protein